MIADDSRRHALKVTSTKEAQLVNEDIYIYAIFILRIYSLLYVKVFNKWVAKSEVHWLYKVRGWGIWLLMSQSFSIHRRIVFKLKSKSSEMVQWSCCKFLYGLWWWSRSRKTHLKLSLKSCKRGGHVRFMIIAVCIIQYQTNDTCSLFWEVPSSWPHRIPIGSKLFVIIREEKSSTATLVAFAPIGIHVCRRLIEFPAHIGILYSF